MKDLDIIYPPSKFYVVWMLPDAGNDGQSYACQLPMRWISALAVYLSSSRTSPALTPAHIMSTFVRVDTKQLRWLLCSCRAMRPYRGGQVKNIAVYFNLVRKSTRSWPLSTYVCVTRVTFTYQQTP